MVSRDLFIPAPHRIQSRRKTDHRITSDTHVCFSASPPWGKSCSGSQSVGVRYENRIKPLLSAHADALGCRLLSHPWIEYGGQFAQPDFILVSPSKAIILFEVKHTWVDTRNQLALYKALLTNLGLSPVTCCTICRNITPATPPLIIHDITDIQEGAVWQIRL